MLMHDTNLEDMIYTEEKGVSHRKNKQILRTEVVK